MNGWMNERDREVMKKYGIMKNEKGTVFVCIERMEMRGTVQIAKDHNFCFKS